MARACLEGWVGKQKPVPHRASVHAPGHAGVTTKVQLLAQTRVSFALCRSPSGQTSKTQMLPVIESLTLWRNLDYAHMD